MPMSPLIGIDFGTTYSKMAWYNPRTHRPEPIRNNEQREQTPSVVYFGENKTCVGDPAVDMLIDEQERVNVIISAKRQLVKNPLQAIPGGSVSTIDIVATILRKLKEDAEKSPLLQGQEVTKAVITSPASFDHIYRDNLRAAGRIAGFQEIELLDEPTAAALAYAQMGPRVGNHVLVYDLGGGTFDLALLAREDDDTFRLIMDPQGIELCGGDDFDEALYDKCDEIAREKYGRLISPTGERDLTFLSECRHWKERLSSQGRLKINYTLQPEGVSFQYEIDRATFEDLIKKTIEDETIRRTEEILRQADADGYTLDTLVLVGGSTNIPLVQRLLTERLHLQPLVWHYQDIAVALGAAFYAYSLWGSENQYRRALRAAWVNQRLDETKIAELTDLANTLELDANQIAELERSSMGDTKVKIFARQVAEDEYRTALQMAWDNKKLDEKKIPGIIELAKQLALTNKQVVDLECEVMGEDKESILAHQHAREQYREAVKSAWADETIDEAKIEQLADLARSLDLSEDHIKAIESEEIGGTKETVLAQQQALAQYREAVNDFWKDKQFDREKLTQLYIMANRLNLSDEQIDTIEFEVMNDIKEKIFVNEYKTSVRISDRERKHVNQFIQMNTIAGHSKAIHSIAFSPDGQTLGSSSTGTHVITQLWNTSSGKLLYTSTWNLRNVLITFAPSGLALVIGVSTSQIGMGPTRFGAIMVYADKDELLYRFTAESHESVSFTLSPDGQTLAVCYEELTVKVWSLQSGEKLRALKLHSGKVNAFSISSDRQTLATSSDDHTVKLWNISTGDLVRTFSWYERSIITVAFSLDGQIVACGDAARFSDGHHYRGIRLWNTVTGQELFTLEGHTKSILCLAFSPDGKKLASGGKDGNVRLWSTQTGELLQNLIGHSSAVNALVFSPDGHTLATGDKYGTIRLWSLKSDSI